MRLFYRHFDGQDEMARDGIVAGLRMLTLREIVDEYREAVRACEGESHTHTHSLTHTRTRTRTPPQASTNDSRARTGVRGAYASAAASSASSLPERQALLEDLPNEELELEEEPDDTRTVDDRRQLLALSEQSGFRRYFCAARTGAVWLEAGFNVYFVAESLTEFLSHQPGSRLRGNLQRGSRQRGNRQRIR